MAILRDAASRLLRMRSLLFYLAPLAGRGRIAVGDPGEGVQEQVSKSPSPRPSPREERGEGEDNPNAYAPEGAQRCRALASGLKDRAAGRKERLFDEWGR